MSEDAILTFWASRAPPTGLPPRSSGVLLATSESGILRPCLAEEDVQPLQPGGLRRHPHLPLLPHLHRQPQRLLVYLG